MQLTDLRWPDVQSLDKDTPVVIPIAALEQHGHHLPLFTDSMILGDIIRRTADALRDKALFAPLLWLGHSEHHLDFPGTLSAPSRLYVDLLAALVTDLLQHGFRRFVLLNGHGGNVVPGHMAIADLRNAHPDRKDLLLLQATYWNLADPGVLSRLGTTQSSMGHACEWETSMILRIRPDLVTSHEALEAVPQAEGFEPAARAWRTADRSSTGHIGQPAAASAEKGEALLVAFAGGVMRLVERMADWDGRSWIST